MDLSVLRSKREEIVKKMVELDRKIFYLYTLMPRRDDEDAEPSDEKRSYYATLKLQLMNLRKAYDTELTALLRSDPITSLSAKMKEVMEYTRILMENLDSLKAQLVQEDNPVLWGLIAARFPGEVSLSVGLAHKQGSAGAAMAAYLAYVVNIPASVAFLESASEDEILTVVNDLEGLTFPHGPPSHQQTEELDAFRARVVEYAAGRNLLRVLQKYHDFLISDGNPCLWLSTIVIEMGGYGAPASYADSNLPENYADSKAHRRSVLRYLVNCWMSSTQAHNADAEIHYLIQIAIDGINLQALTVLLDFDRVKEYIRRTTTLDLTRLTLQDTTIGMFYEYTANATDMFEILVENGLNVTDVSLLDYEDDRINIPFLLRAYKAVYNSPLLNMDATMCEFLKRLLLDIIVHNRPEETIENITMVFDDLTTRCHGGERSLILHAVLDEDDDDDVPPERYLVMKAARFNNVSVLQAADSYAHDDFVTDVVHIGLSYFVQNRHFDALRYFLEIDEILCDSFTLVDILDLIREGRADILTMIIERTKRNSSEERTTTGLALSDSQVMNALAGAGFHRLQQKVHAKFWS